MKHPLRKCPPLLLTWTLLAAATAAPAGAFGRTGGCVIPGAEEEVAAAAAAVAGPAPRAGARDLFARHLKLRGEAIPAADKPKYWRELKAKPELKGTPVYDAGSPQSRAVLKVIRPVLDLYGRDWDVAVLDQGAPFAGTFRQCIFIVSSGLLQLVTDEELKGFAAHELAHECFIEELREADRTHCASAYRLVEYKSDLVAALALLLARGEPLALASGVEKVEAYYLRNGPDVLRDDTHPDSVHRRHCIDLFLMKIREVTVAWKGARCMPLVDTVIRSKYLAY